MKYNAGSVWVSLIIIINIICIYQIKLVNAQPHSSLSPTNIYLYDIDGELLLKPIYPIENDGTILHLNPQTHNGIYTTFQYVGSWNSNQLIKNMSIGTKLSFHFWAQGSKRDVYFSVTLAFGDVAVATNTDIHNLGSSPSEFTANIEINEEDLEQFYMNTNDNLNLIIMYTGSTMGEAELVFGSMEYDSHISFYSDAISIKSVEYKLDKQEVTFNVSFIDAFASEHNELKYNLKFVGPSEPSTVLKPEIHKCETDGSFTLIWIWNFKSEGVKSGDYEATVIIGYDEISSWQETVFFKIPNYENGMINITILLPIIFVLLLFVVILFFIVKKRVRKERVMPFSKEKLITSDNSQIEE
jgi:hypothetical protein